MRKHNKYNMKEPAVFSFRTYGLLLVCFLALNANNLFAQGIHWQESIGRSQLLARENNKLILAEFWAIWCIPCLKMDKEVWLDTAISTLAQNFVCMKFNLSDGWQNAEPYFVDKIPTIMILDYRGEVLYKNENNLSRSEIDEVLSSFPADVSKLNRALIACARDKKDHLSHVNAASAYQSYALQSGQPAREIFIRESKKMLKKTRRIINKKKNYSISERVDLMQNHNDIISGNTEKGIKAVLEQLDIIGEENLAQAYYILVTAYLAEDNRDLAHKYYKELKSKNGSEAFVQLVKHEFE